MSDNTRASNAIVASAFAVALSLAASGGVLAQAKIEMEECYGVVKAGQNDCAVESLGTTCAGTSKADRQVDAYLLVPKGTCGKIAGGALAPPKKT